MILIESVRAYYIWSIVCSVLQGERVTLYTARLQCMSHKKWLSVLGTKNKVIIFSGNNNDMIYLKSIQV